MHATGYSLCYTDMKDDGGFRPNGLQTPDSTPGIMKEAIVLVDSIQFSCTRVPSFLWAGLYNFQYDSSNRTIPINMQGSSEAVLHDSLGLIQYN